VRCTAVVAKPGPKDSAMRFWVLAMESGVPEHMYDLYAGMAGEAVSRYGQRGIDVYTCHLSRVPLVLFDLIAFQCS